MCSVFIAFSPAGNISTVMEQFEQVIRGKVNLNKKDKLNIVD